MHMPYMFLKKRVIELMRGQILNCKSIIQSAHIPSIFYVLWTIA